MNTIKNLVRLTSCTATVLITALWLPTTIFALDLPVRNGSADGVMSLVENCHYDSSHHSRDWLQVEKIGFGETDPASDNYVIGDENDSRSVVTCHGGSSKHVVLEATPS